MFSAARLNSLSEVFNNNLTQHEVSYPGRSSSVAIGTTTQQLQHSQTSSSHLSSSSSIENLTKQPPQIVDIIKNREIGLQRVSRANRQSLDQLISRRLPFGLRQRALLRDLQPQFDKIFASCWLNEDTIAFGTKDNKLNIWELRPNKIFNIPLPHKEVSQSRTPLDSCGVHFITTNADNTQLATGAKQPSQIAIMNLPTLTPQLILEGHQDWVFSAQFLPNNRLASASRDCTICIFDVSTESDISRVRQPLVTRIEHVSKVRDMKYNPNINYFVTADGEGIVKYWDSANLDVINSVAMNNAKEVCCVAQDTDRNLTAVGSKTHTHILDHRTSTVVKSIPSKDDWGIRSLCFNGDILSTGGGKGLMHFYDVRNDCYLPLSQGECIEIATDAGWIVQDAQFLNHFVDVEITHAIYTHSFSPSKAKCFIGGGPLLLGVKGGYGAVWI